ncbi:MAG: CRISPR-associated helicase Cas3' [Magnetococcales bacterium]|nr:CRISPR-associated helicase Cas3' [Magnetococcales bacterium]
MTERPFGFIAHYRKKEDSIQRLDEHLIGVGFLAGKQCAKIGLQSVGELLGLLHDFGKYSDDFQNYLHSATGQLDPDGDNWVDALSLKGKIDHSTAGAQLIWNNWSRYGEKGRLAGQIVALCVASHHSGLIDCLTPEGENGFQKRIDKAKEKTHLQVCQSHADDAIRQRIEHLGNLEHLKQFLQSLTPIVTIERPLQRDLYLGLLTRFIFSALIDADRQDSADFEIPENRKQRQPEKPDWSVSVQRLNSALANWPDTTPIDAIRRHISHNCQKRAHEPRGLYTLTVPTGGGKTLASLRFALHHAEKHLMDRIIIIIPYTSIIEQNAAAIRELLEQEGDPWPWVLEQHSNLEPQQQTWHGKLASENWSAPLVLTTMVQFLETLFSGGTRSVRRLHQLANSVLIFDEIQTLPVRSIHLFCNALNFLVDHAQTTALLCTATQPRLHQLKQPERGALNLDPAKELVGDVDKLFRQLNRVALIDRRKTSGWSCSELSELAQQQLAETGSCLVIVNTKRWAKNLFLACAEQVEMATLFHLSTHQCPSHRKTLFTTIRQRLEAGLPVLCISTQLIEAGVDIDFSTVIRFLAGMDSIAQAAGRCNRHGRREQGQVLIVNPDRESLAKLHDIRIGRDVAQRVMEEFSTDQWLTPRVMDRYFDLYYFNRSLDMCYVVKGSNDSLLNWLGSNQKNSGYQEVGVPKLQQSFGSAGRHFQSIDAPTQPVLISYGDGKKIIEELCAISKQFDPNRYRQRLRAAQPYSVNLFHHEQQQLVQAGALHEMGQGEGLYYLDERHYSQTFGVSEEPVAGMGFIMI